MLWAKDSVVSIATRYGWTVRGFSTPVHNGPGGHPASYTMGTGSFPGVKSGPGVALTTRHI